jgi:hypothetical protein
MSPLRAEAIAGYCAKPVTFLTGQTGKPRRKTLGADPKSAEICNSFHAIAAHLQLMATRGKL